MPLALIVNGSESSGVNEGSHADLEFDLQDKNETAIPDTNISEAKLWLSLKGEGTIINNRDGIDVVSNFNSQGHFLFTLEPDDNQIISTATGLKNETHLVTIKITTTTPSSIIYNEQMTFKVTNLEKIPTS